MRVDINPQASGGGNNTTYLRVNVYGGHQSQQGGLDSQSRQASRANMMEAKQPSDIFPANSVYARLLRKGFGYLLWFPERVDIGDVGFFNICRSADDPVNIVLVQSVPAGFEPMTLERIDYGGRHVHTAPTDISSLGISRTQLEAGNSENVRGTSARLSGSFDFRCSGSEGAVLMFPEGGYRKELLAEDRFEEYTKHYAATWYPFARHKLEFIDIFWQLWINGRRIRRAAV